MEGIRSGIGTLFIEFQKNININIKKNTHKGGP
jgi:hypothetical protein